MSLLQPFAYRSLDPADQAEARALAARAGAHGAYVRNALEGDWIDAADGEMFGLYGAEALLGLVYFGARGNLIVVQGAAVETDRLAEAIARSEWQWRIALAAAPLVAALRAREERLPLVDREQVYYSVSAADLDERPGKAPERAALEAMRVAVKADSKSLMVAALDLNDTDLNVAPWRVHRRWLRETVRRRIREGSTFVLGPVGAMICKLDLGSVGVGGVVIEGVYTDPKHRGRGLATSLVAAVIRAQLHAHPLVCLHVAADNLPARRAYERAGMREAGGCRLLLRG